MADSTVVDKFNRTCTHLYDLRFPVMKGTTDFKGSFKSSLNNEESINLIEKLTLTRTDMVNTFSQLSTPDAKLAVVDNYLPNIFLLMTTLNNQDKITFDRNISFEWRGSLTITEEYYKSSDVTYEVIMVLQTKAVLHNAVAKNLVETDPVAFLTEAGKHLLTASSIMQYLHSNLLTKWNQSFNLKVANPIELNVKVVLALALLFKAGAQSMAVTKALNNDTTPATIKARLSISVVNTIILSFNEVNYLPTATTLFPFMLTHMAVVREFYSAVTNLYLAQSHQDKHEVGIAIAFCNAAKRRLQEQVGPKHRPIDGGLPKLTGLYTINLAPAVAYLHAKIDALLKVAEQENRFIYFLVVPAQLPEWPAEASVMNPTAYEEPVYAGEPIVFEYKPPRTIMGSIFSSFRSSSDAKPATAPVAATVLSVDTPTTGPVVEAAAVQTSGSSSILVPGVPIPQPPAAIPASSSSNSNNSNNTAQLQADEAFARQLQQQLHLEESKASAPPASAPPSAYAQPQPLPYQPQSHYQLPYQPSQQYQQQQYQHPPPPPQQQYQYNPNSVPQQQPQQAQQQYSASAPAGVHHNGVNYPQI